MILADLQSLLNDLYDLEIAYDVYDFLITDERIAGALDRGGRDPREKLLIYEGPEEAEVSLYLDAALMQRLEQDDPVARLSGSNIADFWLAFEGISHFTYYAFRAGVEKPVTLLEMELQAEVDKFVATALLLRRQGERPPRSLHHWLFCLPKFDTELSRNELERYGYANYYASKYCAQLFPRLAVDSETAAVERELRRFYRYSQPAKIGHIEQLRSPAGR